MTYDDWKTRSPEDDQREQVPAEEPDWDSINDAKREDRLTLDDEPWYN